MAGLICPRRGCGARYSSGTNCRRCFATLVPDPGCPAPNVADAVGRDAQTPEPDRADNPQTVEPGVAASAESCLSCDAARPDSSAARCDYCGAAFSDPALDGHVLRLAGPWGQLELGAEPVEIGRESPDGAVASALESYDVVSRRHAVIAVRDGRAWVTDLRSANGTYINDEPLQPDVPAPAGPGDIVRLGSRVRLQLRSANE